jgi:3-hydroxyacyl-CoA dehydrogenase/enoyl-CoA hydratase/3-hydroxybutyryl-CoA epimerase
MANASNEAHAALTRPPLTLPKGAPIAIDPPLRHWRLIAEGEVLWAVIDKQGASANTLSGDVLRDLDRLLDVASGRAAKALVIRSGKANGFVAGADIGEFVGLNDEAAVRALIEKGLAVLDKLARFPAPTIALIHGFCLGGGLELALSCRYRIAADDARFGFPEVMLGLHPGLSGTWRSLALMKPVDAMTAMLTGKTLIARKARAQGLIDAVTEERHFAEAVRQAVKGEVRRRDAKGLIGRVINRSPVRGLIAQRMEKETARKARRDHYPAPFALIDLWKAHGDDARSLRPAETASFARLLVGETAQNLVRCFFLREKLKGYAKGAEHGITHVHVIGAGVMGGDIAAWAALRGFRVTLEDRELKFIAPAIGRAGELFAKRLYSDKDRQAAFDRLMPDVAGSGLAKADLVIEVVPENPAIKHEVYARAEAAMKKGAILATNTSSLLLEELARGLKHPDRFCGIHFFNPVAQMPLVEVVRHRGLDQAVEKRALAFVEALDKLPLPVASAPGFLVNRALTPYMMEAFLAYAEGAGPEVIDATMEAFGMPMGPMELADQVGLDVGLHVAQVLKRDVKDRALPEVPDWFETLVKSGHLGKKSGKGVYEWKDGRPVKAGEARPDAAIEERLVLSLLNAVADCLAATLVEDADAADAAMIFGTGFAPFRGGPLHYARKRGIAEIVARLEALESALGSRFAPSRGWEMLAAGNPAPQTA